MNDKCISTLPSALSQVDSKYYITITYRSASAAQPNYALLSQSLMDACQGIEPATH